MSKQMTPGDLARRKKIQADLSIVGGTLGLTALGAKGASAGLRRAGKTVAAARTEKPVVGLLTGGAGVGGVGAFNFAATQKAEAAGVRPKMDRVSKAKKKVTNNDLAMAGGATAAATGARFSGQTYADGAKKAMQESAKINYKSNRELLGQGKVRSALRTAKAQLRANPAKMVNYRPEQSGWSKTTEKVTSKIVGEDAAKDITRLAGEETRNALKGVKGYGAKYYSKKPLLIGGSAVAAGAYANKKYKLAKAYDPEKNRARRADVYTGAAGAGSVFLGAKGINSARPEAGRQLKLARRNVKFSRGYINYGRADMAEAKSNAVKAKNSTNKSAATGYRIKSKNAKTSAKVQYKTAGGYAKLAGKRVFSAGKIVGTSKPVIAAAALAGTAGAIQHQKKNSGRTYTNWYDGNKKPKFSRVDNTTATSN